METPQTYTRRSWDRRAMRSKGGIQQQPRSSAPLLYNIQHGQEEGSQCGRRCLRRSALRMLTSGTRVVVSAHTVSIQAKGSVIGAVRVSASGEDFW